jgi:hypothetical protein
MIPVLIAVVVIAIAAVLAFRWFERYRYTDAWRQSEFRDWAFGFLMWFGGLFGHRVPPPPQPKVEFTAKAREPPESGGPALPDDAADEKE